MKKISEIKSEINIRKEINTKQIDIVITTVSLITTICILLALNYLIFATYHVDTNPIIEQANKFSYKSSGAFAPEPVERAQYLLSILLSPFIISISYLLINKYIKPMLTPITDFDTYYTAFIMTTPLIAGILLLWLIINSAIFISIYTPTLIYSNGLILVIYLLILLPGVITAVWLSRKPETNKITSAIYGFIALITILLIFFMGLFNKNPTYSVYHFNAMFYSVSQVVMGKTLLVDFNNTYGLYPHLLEPIFRIIGLSVLNYSIVMSALTALAFILIYLFLKDNISNKIIATMGFTSVIFINYLIFKLDTLALFDSYNQYWPLRFIFPAVLIFLGTLYIKTNSKIIYYSSWIAAAVSILWNIDSGIFVFASWLLLLVYIELYNTDKKCALKNIVMHTITAGNSIILVFGIYAIHIFIRCRTFVDFIQMLEIPQFYVMYGFEMLPLPQVHVWIAVFIVYLCGLVYSIKSLINGENQERGKIIWLLSILGIGLFTYYLGRSHDQVLLTPAYIAVILITIYADISFTEWVRWGNKLGHHAITTIFLLLILSASFFNLIGHSGQIITFAGNGLSALNDTQQSDTTINIDFIKTHTAYGEKIYIYANNYDGLYYGESHTVSALDIPGHTDQFFIRDHDKITKFLIENKNTKIFLARSNNEAIAEPDRVPNFNDIISQRYNIVDLSPNDQVALVIPRIDI